MLTLDRRKGTGHNTSNNSINTVYTRPQGNEQDIIKSLTQLVMFTKYHKEMNRTYCKQ